MTDTTDQSRRAQKAPLPPDVLADARHDRTHPNSGRLLHASPILPATDHREGGSEYTGLLADLDFYDEDHWRNVMRQYPGAQAAIRSAAAAIRALEAKVREEHGRAVRVQATVDYLFPSYEEANRRLAAEILRLTSELAAARENEARWKLIRSSWVMAGAINNGTQYYGDMLDRFADAAIDAARRAGEGEV